MHTGQRRDGRRAYLLVFVALVVLLSARTTATRARRTRTRATKDFMVVLGSCRGFPVVVLSVGAFWRHFGGVFGRSSIVRLESVRSFATSIDFHTVTNAIPSTAAAKLVEFV